MMSLPFMPHHAKPIFWVSVFACFGFWLAVYVIIIQRGIKDKSYGMPIGALCGNIAWEFMFSCIFLADYLAIRIGNFLWLLLDMGILWTVVKHGKADFSAPFMKKWLYPIILIGVFMAAFLGIPFVKVYKDTQGFLTGWIQAFLMSILFISMLVRRDDVRGQSLYIALFMFLGNVPAYYWVKYFPDPIGGLDSRMNFAITVATCILNLIYIALIYQKCRRQSINPWTRL
ncbi:MAG: hypothetical protein HY735_35360 [Verrucomicrobia bacterium]|nr:hypothetical protein [Verrucomicrobiota bacterium]